MYNLRNTGSTKVLKKCLLHDLLYNTFFKNNSVFSHLTECPESGL